MLQLGVVVKGTSRGVKSECLFLLVVEQQVDVSS